MGGLAIGAGSGLAAGVAIAFLHLNVPTLAFLGFALTPSISGLLLGSVVGLLIGLTAGCGGQVERESRFLTRLCRRAKARLAVDFCAKSGFGMTTVAAGVQPIAIRSWGMRAAGRRLVASQVRVGRRGRA